MQSLIGRDKNGVRLRVALANVKILLVSLSLKERKKDPKMEKVYKQRKINDKEKALIIYWREELNQKKEKERKKQTNKNETNKESNKEGNRK